MFSCIVEVNDMRVKGKIHGKKGGNFLVKFDPKQNVISDRYILIDPHDVYLNASDLDDMIEDIELFI